MADAQRTTDNEHKSNIIDNSVGAMMGEEEYVTASSSADIGNMVSGDSPPLKPTDVLQLQRQLGNRFTTNLVARQAKPKSQTDATTAFAGLKMAIPNQVGVIQREPTSDGGGSGGGNDNESVDDEDTTNALDQDDNEVQEDNTALDNLNTEDDPRFSPISEQMKKPENPNTYMVDWDDDDDDDMDIATNKDGLDNSDLAPTTIDTDTTGGIQKNKRNKFSTGKLGVPKSKDQLGNQPLRIKGKDRLALGVGDDTSVTMEGLKNTGKDAGLIWSAVQSGKTLKDGLGQGASATEIGADSTMSAFEKFLAVMKIVGAEFLLPIGLLVQRVYGVTVKRKHMKAYKKMADLAGAGEEDFDKAKDKKTYAANSDALLGAYAYNKTRRGFWLRIAQAAALAGQILSRLVTFLTGGLAGPATEVIDLSLGLFNAATKLGTALKGLFKMIKLTRGKRRAQAADQLVDNGIRGEMLSLQTMIDAEALSKAWFAKRTALFNMTNPTKNKQKFEDFKKLTVRPKTIEEMQDYLLLAQKYKLIKSIKMQVAESMKST